MRKFAVIIMALCLVVNFSLAGCGAKKADTGTDAIEQAKTMKTVDQKKEYLLDQAQAFINAREFQYAIDVIQYTLKNVDANSEEAKKLLSKAQSAMMVQMQRIKG